MRTHFLLFALLAFGWQFVQGQKIFVPEDSKLPVHPRLLLQKGEEKTLKKQIRQDAIWTEIHAKIMEEADELLSAPVNERVLTGKRLLSVSRENLRRIFFLSYAYRMSGDRKYVQRAEQEMLKAASFSDWNPSHFLDVGEMTMGLAIGYDWLYNQLSSQSKNTIEQAIIEKGLLPSFDERYNWFVNVNHNWNQVCHAGMTYGALAIWEKDRSLSAKVINRAIEKIANPMEHYGPDGTYPEGVGYWEYGTSFNVMFLSAIEKVFKSDFGLAQIPGFLKTGHYLLHMVTPGLRNFNYSDNGAKAFLTPTIFWFYNKTREASILYNQSLLLQERGSSVIKGDRLAPAMLIWGASASLTNPVKPQPLFWIGQGDNPVCAMRSEWGNKNALYVGFKSGSPSVNHGHMDVGSFIFEADGIDWAIDLGADNYNRLETRGVDLWNTKQNSQRWDVFRYNNLTHNTLSFNEKYQLVEGKAKIEDFGSKENNMYAISDLTEVYQNQVKGVKRAISMVNKEYAVVEDLIETGKWFTKMSWTWVTPAIPKIISDTVLELEKDGKKLYLKVEGMDNSYWEIKPAQSRFSYDSPNPGVSIVTLNTDLKPASKQKFTVYIFPNEIRNSDYKPKLKLE